MGYVKKVQKSQNQVKNQHFRIQDLELQHTKYNYFYNNKAKQPCNNLKYLTKEGIIGILYLLFVSFIFNNKARVLPHRRRKRGARPPNNLRGGGQRTHCPPQ